MPLPELDQATRRTIPELTRLIQIGSPVLCTMGQFHKVVHSDTQLIKEVLFQIVQGNE